MKEPFVKKNAILEDIYINVSDAKMSLMISNYHMKKQNNFDIQKMSLKFSVAMRYNLFIVL